MTTKPTNAASLHLTSEYQSFAKIEIDLDSRVHFWLVRVWIPIRFYRYIQRLI